MSDPALTVSKNDPDYWKTMYQSLLNEKTYWKNKTVDLQAEVREAKALLKLSTDKIVELQANKQARIDELMFEYCPDEMTSAQIAEWEKHQVVSPLEPTEKDE